MQEVGAFLIVSILVGLAIRLSGDAVSMRQHLKAHQRVTVRFRLQSPDGREIIEELAAKEIWQCGDNTGLEFDPPLTAGSPALQKARYLVAHLVEKESGR